jgi:hypothetical protein
MEPGNIIIFHVEDPRGIKVVLYMSEWIHILDDHPNLQNRINDIKNSLISPMYICKDVDYDNRQVYYQVVNGKQKYHKTVIELFSNGDAKVVTSYTTMTGKAGEYIIWPQSKT